MRLAITGSSGYLGRLMLSSLDEESQVAQILGLDIVDTLYRSTKFKHLKMDTRSPQVAQVLKDHRIDAVLHMAWIFDPIHNSRTAYDVDVNGSKNVLESCRDAGVEHIVILGSTTAYGAHPDNPDWIIEESPIRGNRDFPYSWHKVLVEEFCDGFEKDNPQISLTRLRACIVLGKNVDNFIKTLILMRGLKHAIIGNSYPQMQFLHEDDIVSLLKLAVLRRPRGAYNVAPDDTVALNEIPQIMENPVVEYPYWLLRPLTGLLWSLRQVPIPASYLSFIRYRWTASNDKIKRELCWSPKYSSREALEALKAR